MKGYFKTIQCFVHASQKANFVSSSGVNAIDIMFGNGKAAKFKFIIEMERMFFQLRNIRVSR